MPVTLLDVIVLAVMLLSGLLAMIRGFMREILSIAAWGCAALATLYAFPRLLPTAKQYFNNDTVAMGAVVGGVFLGTLIVVSIITVRISDMVLDSRIGALDRTLGFLFGLARGLLIIVVAFQFFVWLVPPQGQPDWVKNAKSLNVLVATGNWIRDSIPEDLLNNVTKKLNKKDDDTQTDAAPDAAPAGSPRASLDGGYSQSSRDGMQKLIEASSARSR